MTEKDDTNKDKDEENKENGKSKLDWDDDEVTEPIHVPRLREEELCDMEEPMDLEDRLNRLLKLPNWRNQ